MSESYTELLIKRKPAFALVVVKALLLGLTGACFVMTLFGNPFTLFGVVIFGFIFWFVRGKTDLEYEYLYLDKEITIDKVMAKSKRKRVAAFEVERIEILAPIKSYHLDNYKNRDAKAIDYSSGVENQPDTRYVMYYDGGTKVILEPNMEMVQAIKNVAPRKVFTD